MSYNTWRVVLNSKLWNQKKFEEDWKENIVFRIPQSKGKCTIKNIPKKMILYYLDFFFKILLF